MDYHGWVFVNGEEVGEFEGSHVPYIFNLTGHMREKNNVLRIVFDVPPRWLGQFGYTSKMTDWKPRFNYTWDWTVRLVQTGVWDSISLAESDGREIRSLDCSTNADPTTGRGILTAKGEIIGCDSELVRIILSRDGKVIRQEDMATAEFAKSGMHWRNLDVELWWPNLMGEHPLYDLECRLIDANGRDIDKLVRRVGFKNVTWRQCEGAPKDAYPNLCVVNGKPVFLQGVNWTPIRPNFADVTEEDYRKRLSLYKSLGFNLMRVWGGATLERECFYNLCDEMGLMVWQEFPMSSSGIENLPPSDNKSVEEMAAIAESYIARRRHHVSLIAWCGGNELQTTSSVESQGRPVDDSHPMIRRLKKIVVEHDPDRRFFFTSPSGPVFQASAENFGKGIHWHVHGPWKAEGDLAEWKAYWEHDDAMLRTETGAPGASSADLIRKYAGEYAVMPVTTANPLWHRACSWWVERDQFVREHGREPVSLEEYVDWSQKRQSDALVIALSSCKKRFPRCGGFVIWMGHDCFPCNANTSIVDFEGNPKPAALALAKILRNEE